MSSVAVETVTKILETLPDSEQDRVLEHLREYIETLADELRWNASFEKTQSQLSEAGRHAREEIARGLAKPLDLDQL